MSVATIQQNVSLAPYTSFGVGGPAEFFAEVSTTEELIAVLKNNTHEQVWLLGYGSNTLISDQGLPGLTVVMKGGKIAVDHTIVTADAGVWWDDIVKVSIEQNLWGLELMSEIPGSLGAALFINITAYGQSIGPKVSWIDTWNPAEKQVVRLDKQQLDWDYKSSIFQTPAHKNTIILRAGFELAKQPDTQLTYQKAVDVAEELGLSPDTLEDRRAIIIEARRRAGSLWTPNDESSARTVGSFFRNPVVSPKQAELIIAFDETGKTAAQINNMNKVHGGDSRRVSAAHVMLASGFSRGQMFNNVKLNDQNLLKIEALPGANAADVYAAMSHIQQVCFHKTGVQLEPEARMLGNFSQS